MLVNKNSTLFHKYKIITKIGQGGFSEVYKVELNTKPGIYYALKYFLVKNQSDAETTIKRFKQEINLYKKIKSHRVAQYIDSYIGDNEQYLVTEFIDGENLRTIINKNGKLISKTAANYAMQIAEGISELHNSKIIHRDIKSQNILITKDREVKIIDLGLALSEDSQRYTKDSKLIGSVYYMAPELCNVDNSPNEKTDIYALGIMLFEMLSGEYPIKGRDAFDTLNKQKNQAMPEITKLVNTPQALSNIIAKATVKDPQKRYKTMWDMYLDLKTSTSPERYYEKPYNPKKAREKKTIQDIVNSNKFIISAITILTLLLITGIIVLTILI
ncbi:serine/threonine protein kinase [Mycoplasmopsis phocirhinis]|uniref:Serine/threonine protein kinase n=1 Tax=Mycoplasmopsis phocirhinis TaxID=142650 RepID=A0A4P6MMN6_9BACT|nr:serine/threonine-protein kinase [Mycoplasmopsis phocirhinis]QBF34778.1 serine/threonine protein kinase [Mycoplasmopsis phocirhinis]